VDPLKKAASFLIALPIAYAAFYYAILALPSNLVIINGSRMPDFHGVPSYLLAPMHHLDVIYLRPTYWQPYPRHAELSFDWLK
jgi:hypothetical protein